MLILIFVKRLVVLYLAGIDAVKLDKQGLQIEFLGKFIFYHFEQFHFSDDLFKGFVSQRGKNLSDILCKKGKVVDHTLDVTFELLTQMRILGSDTHCTGIEVTDTEHHTPYDDQCTGTECILLCTEDRRFDHIQTGFETTVSFKCHKPS